ncbi:MAG: 2-amino-4-hydroxy-6-hydroxymethyldihydropteridine diphosphokinase [Paludibacteraceae bacterium]|nr:2-amino-4-hydroxy-6-hydroxymethyldihydropteridine diphosphokinase [Paludibacteraceae bacterium]
MIYYLSLGSNLGNREQTLRQAVQLIEQHIGPVRRCSSFYYSEPWGFDSENKFCNLCCSLECDKTPLEVLRLTQSIEHALGRTKKTSPQSSLSTLPAYFDRPIDIDLIRTFDDSGAEIKCQNDQILTLPHPLWQERDFVKVPLAEIMQ